MKKTNPIYYIVLGILFTIASLITIASVQDEITVGKAIVKDTLNGGLLLDRTYFKGDSTHVKGILGVNGQTKLRGEMFFGNSAGTNIYWNGGSDPGFNLTAGSNEIIHNVPSGGSHTFSIGGTPYLAVTDSGVVHFPIAEGEAGRNTFFINGKNNLPYFKDEGGALYTFDLTAE